MATTETNENALLVPRNFIQAMRESGYLSLSTALAELLDNSLQAGATTVNIAISRALTSDLPTITVEDDGDGMSREELAACLRFGGSSRFNSRVSFGRFGMGLPAASLSQARRVEVTAWQPTTPPLTVSLDADEVSKGRPALLAPTVGEGGPSASGCRVVWKDCDRVEYRRIGWLEKSLHRDLGRMFRRFLEQGVTLTINSVKVEAWDPLRLSTTLNGHAARLAFDPMQYEISTGSGNTSRVTVTFSMLPVARWQGLDNASKRRFGVVGHGGVSILRAGREIASGWYFMGGKRKENYDDWWRCQIEFDPSLDEQFGIASNKQGVRPTAALREALEPEIESIARMLNVRVRRAFEEVKFEAAVQGSCRIAAATDPDLPVVKSPGRESGSLRYHLGVEQIPGESMFDLSLKQRTLDVTMNLDHPGFAALYRPLLELGESAGPIRTALELLLLSFARSVTITAASDEKKRELLELWGSTYGQMLQRL